MADREKKEGKLKSMLSSLLSSEKKPEKKEEENAVADSQTEPQQEGARPEGQAAGEGLAHPIMDSLRRDAAADEEGEQGEEQEPLSEEEDENRLLIAGNPLYELYMRRKGLEPVGDEKATFSLSLFIDDELAPTGEQRSWFGRLESEARALLRKTTRPETEEELTEEESLDATILTFITRDKMDAFVFAFPPTFYGREADEEYLREVLAEAGVLFGIDEQRVHSFGESPAYFRLYSVATGEQPVDGDNGEVVDHFNRETRIRLKVREDNTIDYKDLGWLQTVNEGEAICVLVPPTEAIPGHDVTGAEVKGKNGQKATAPMGQNTKMSEDGTTLLATIEGVVSFSNGRFRVDPILIIKGDVETETGNLDMIGDILIHGDIHEGFTVQASGNITVQGMIEGANVMAGGDIQVGRGMNGNSHGVLQAKGEVRSKFIENATVTAGEKVICDTIINSTVSSDVAIEVTTGRGAIIGGSITALERIEAKSIGNQSNRNIVITMGSTANLLRNKHELEQKRQVLEDEVEETEKNINFLDAGVNTTPELTQMSDDLKLKLSVQKMQLANTIRSLEAMNKKQVNNASCRLRTDVLYPPAQITIGDATKIIRDMSFNATVYYKKGEIEIANI
ncbi:FapA family protein [Ruminococcaceae bacterium OttesenSCG-928-I18]|nr:FapA family protein [Ruminococcaceae bacterium OttesenSCG-928-I18]